MLSAEGTLAYTPTKPPAWDYFFQYTWIFPGIFNPQVNLRDHRYFGSPLKDSAASFLFSIYGQMPAEEMDRRSKDTASSDSLQTTS